MMLPHSETVEAHLLGQHCLFNDFAEHLRLGLQRAGRIERYIAKRIETKFKSGSSHSPTVLRYCLRAINSATS